MEYLDELHTELDEAEKQFNYYQKNNAHWLLYKCMLKYYIS
jgi:hypothetical protein